MHKARTLLCGMTRATTTTRERQNNIIINTQHTPLPLIHDFLVIN